MGESTIIKVISTAISSGLIYLIGGGDLLIITLLIFLVLDYATGIFKGAKNGELNSMRGYQGIMKKVGVMIGVIIAVQLDRLVGSEMFRNSTITFFVLNEGISIVENLTIIGVELPQPLVKFMKAWKEQENDREV